MYISAPVMVLYLVLLAIVGILARRIAVFVVSGYGVAGAVILIAAVFVLAKYLSVRHDL